MNLTGLFPQPPYPWFQNQWQTFTQQVDAGRVPHALLLSGPSGIGCEAMAHAMAQFLLCQASQRHASCGLCKSCLLLQADSHPDLLTVTYEEKAKAIKIDQIRRVTQVTANTAQQGGRKLVVIYPAEAMNANSANALLKNLEEPSGSSVFILMAEQPAFLMATIRSRCSKIVCATPAIEDSLQWLERNQVPNAAALLAEASGRPLRVMTWLQADTWGQRDNLRKQLVRLLTSDYSFIDCSKALLPLDLEWVCEQIHDWLSRAIVLAVANKPLAVDDPLLNLLLLAPRVRLFALYDMLLVKKKHLRSGANPNHQLLLDEITMDLKEFCRN